MCSGFHWRVFYFMKDENYILVAGWMRNRLGLKGTQLLIYATIYGFSQDGESFFDGSTEYLAETVGATKESVRKNLIKLCEGGYLVKRTEVRKKVTFNSYAVNFGGGTKILANEPKNLFEGDQNFWSNNIDNNNKEENKDNNIYAKPKKSVYDKTKKTLMSENPVLADINYVLEKFSSEVYKDIDIVYYYHAVMDWSESSNTKRHENGWISTMRNFMRKDREENKLHLKNQTTMQQGGKVNIDEAMQYLNM